MNTVETAAVALWAVAVAFPSSAQTNFGAITFTNKSGDVISNAEVVKVQPDSLIYFFGANGGVVKFADLPAQIQARFGYDAAKAADADAARQQRQSALEAQRSAQQELDAWRGPPKKAHVLKIVSRGGYLEYQVDVDGGSKEIIIPNFPADARKYFDDLAALETAFQAATNQVAMDQAAEPLGNPEGRSRAARIQREQIAQAKKVVSEDQKQVTQAKSAIDHLEKDDSTRTTFLISQTAKKYGNAEIWVYVGR